MRRTLTDSIIANLKVKKRENIADPQCAGHYVRVTPNGSKTFWAVARDPNGKQQWEKLGDCDHLKLEASREEARRWIGATKRGESTAGPETIETVTADWIEHHLEERGVITAKNKIRYLKNHILPAFPGREFSSIKRSEIRQLMRATKKTAGPVAADEVLSVMRGLCNWYAMDNDDYSSPIIKGMRLTSTKERARDRVLTDEEIEALWAVKATTPALPIAKLLLLTGQRRTKVASMRWEDIADGYWTVPKFSKREKENGGKLKLPAEALAIIEAQPRFAHSLFVFPAQRGSGHFRAYTDGAAAIVGGADWELHDLRRTADGCMARARVPRDIIERVLGHAKGGVRGVYDRFEYTDEKAEALERLAAVVRDIVNPPPANVVNMRKKLSRRA
jgi:integrase